MPQIKVHDKTFDTFLSELEIHNQIKRIAAEVNKDFAGKRPLFIAILNGSFMFASDLFKELTIEAEVCFIKLASYKGIKSTGQVVTSIGLDVSLKCRDVVIIEDIVDTGNTIENVWEQLKSLGAAEIKIATLLFKPNAYTKTVPIEYAAIVIPNDFIVGYGLDYKGLGRNLEDIYVLDYENDKK